MRHRSCRLQGPQSVAGAGSAVRWLAGAGQQGGYRPAVMWGLGSRAAGLLSCLASHWRMWRKLHTHHHKHAH